jgi:shikimate dehydrogenase
MKHVYLLGWPLGHSLSPVMQNAAFQALGLDWQYGLLEAPPEDLPEAVARLRRADVAGANATIPHKQAVIPLIDALSERAARVGAVNTIVKRDGRLTGENTDVDGVIRVLKDSQVGLRGARVVVLGAGGAARAVAFALAESAASITLFNRTASRAVALAADVTRAYRRLEVQVNDLAKIEAADLIVNATSVGMVPNIEASPMPPGAEFRPGVVAFDLVYRPLKTRFLREAEQSGARTVDGLALLVHQGAAAFKLWTGLDAPLEVMFDAASRAERAGS